MFAKLDPSKLLKTSSKNAKDLNSKESRSRSPTPSGMSTPLRLAPRSLRPYIQAIIAFNDGRSFQSQPSVHRSRTFSNVLEKEGQFGASLTSLYVGISAVFSENHTAVVAIAIHDSIYLHDFSVKNLELDHSKRADQEIMTNYIISELQAYERKNICKFIGAGLPHELMEKAPNLCSRLWAELDTVPIAIYSDKEKGYKNKEYWDLKCVDEQADSMARKCVMYFGPSKSPLLHVGFRGVVEIDAGFHTHMCTVDNYKASCKDPTWRAMMKYATELEKKCVKIAFFSSTPQGGGVALMRHALVRFARVMGVDLTWYVPKPRPGVFRVTKNIHNILQGVAQPDLWVTPDDKKVVTGWIADNATRYWFSDGGPLLDPSEGGADVIVIDDPQMPGLIPLIKKVTPNRPVLYRSHIQIRSDLCETKGTPQADIWQSLWENIQYADMFISHPMPSFVPTNVPREKVAYMPATTDWLDGLNKTLSDWDMGYYGHQYNTQCLSVRMTQLKYPLCKYFIQIARFDPSKGIPDVIKSYAEFRDLLKKQGDDPNPPQLLIVGNGSVDDPDATQIYDSTLEHLELHCPDLIPFVSVMRLDANDQLLDTLLSNAHTVLQLSTREGFEVKVSEALHKGKPVIATNVGGIPLQVQHCKNGFLVEAGDWHAVAARLLELWTDKEKYELMSNYARRSVSDEVGTVGNALNWFYLASKWASGEAIRPNENWVNDLARGEAGVPYVDGENRLPRSSTAKKHA